jgi:virginiamycin B lyase
MKLKLLLRLLVLLPLPGSLPLLAQTGDLIRTAIDKACYKVITVTARPDFIAADGNYAWVVDDNNSGIKKISAHDTKPLLAVTVPGACAAPVVAFDAVWVVSCAEKKLYKIDRTTGRVLAKITTGVADANGEMSLAAGSGSIWLLSDSSGVLTRINPQTNTIQATVQVRPHSYCAAYGYHAVWVTSTGESTVQRVDAGRNTVVATIPVGKNPRFISVGDQGVWTLNQGDGTVTKIDPETNQVTATIDVQAKGPGGDISEGGGKVWIVSTNIARPVQTINTATNAVEMIYDQAGGDGKPFRVDGAVRVSGSYVWVSGLYRQKVWVFKK